MKSFRYDYTPEEMPDWVYFLFLPLAVLVFLILLITGNEEEQTG